MIGLSTMPALVMSLSWSCLLSTGSTYWMLATVGSRPCSTSPLMRATSWSSRSCSNCHPNLQVKHISWTRWREEYKWRYRGTFWFTHYYHKRLCLHVDKNFHIKYSNFCCFSTATHLVCVLVHPAFKALDTCARSLFSLPLPLPTFICCSHYGITIQCLYIYTPTTGFRGRHSLYNAISKDIVQLLLEFHNNGSTTPPTGETWEPFNSSWPICSSINEAKDDGFTSLHLALLNNHIEVAQALIAHMSVQVSHFWIQITCASNSTSDSEC